jgi:hypothetical protein
MNPSWTFRSAAVLILLATAVARPAVGGIPTYRLVVIDEYSSSTTVRSASDNGIVVGTQIVTGVQRAFVATEQDGIRLLPLPTGYQSAEAYDVNDQGLIVGTAAISSLAADFGEPVAWVPNGEGSYTPVIPEQFTTLPGPLGEMPIDGGQIVAVSDNGHLIGWSRYQGFQGGPATRFFLDATPLNLAGLGMQATPRDVNDAGMVVGGQLKFDLVDNTVTDIGVPPELPTGTPFTDAIIFAINDSGQSVVAANLASTPTENYLTYRHDDKLGYQRLNPAQLPSRFVGFYDNNDQGDVLASGGVYFAAEDQLFGTVEELLAPEYDNWSIDGGFITDDRSVYGAASNPATGQNAVVVLQVIVENLIFSSDFESNHQQP